MTSRRDQCGGQRCHHQVQGAGRDERLQLDCAVGRAHERLLGRARHDDLSHQQSVPEGLELHVLPLKENDLALTTSWDEFVNAYAQ